MFILGLVITSVVSYYYITGNNWANALMEDAAFANEHLEIDVDTTRLSYYSSIFSNLSRGLPIDSSSEPTDGQEEEEDEEEVNLQVNTNSTVQQS